MRVAKKGEICWSGYRR